MKKLTKREYKILLALANKEVEEWLKFILQLNKEYGKKK